MLACSSPQVQWCQPTGSLSLHLCGLCSGSLRSVGEHLLVPPGVVWLTWAIRVMPNQSLGHVPASLKLPLARQGVRGGKWAACLRGSLPPVGPPCAESKLGIEPREGSGPTSARMNSRILPRAGAPSLKSLDRSEVPEMLLKLFVMSLSYCGCVHFFLKQGPYVPIYSLLKILL